MNKDELIALGLSDEQATKVLDGFKDYIPRSRFNEVNEAKKNAENLLTERDKQLAELKKSNGENEELKKQIETLQAENKDAKAKYELELKQLQITNAVERELIASGAKNTKAVKALLNLENAEMDGDTVKGLADQIKALKENEDSKFLFAEKQITTPPSGVKAGEGGDKGGQKAVKDMNYSERVAFLAAGGKLE